MVDFAIVSQFAAETAHIHGFNIHTVMTLDAGSYTSEHVLLLNQTEGAEIHDGMRIGIDMMSADHARIVHTVCQGKSVKFINIDYSQALRALNAKQIDATVWTEEDLPVEFAKLKTIRLDKEDYPILDSLSIATIVVQHDNISIVSILKSLLDTSNLQRIQCEVVDFTKLPVY